MTVRSIFEKLQQNGPLSRADLTRETGISAPTVSKVITELIDQGLVEETLLSENPLGRPGKRLCIARQRSRVLGINVGSSVTTVTLASLDGQIDVKHCQSITTSESYAEWLSAIGQHVNRISQSEACDVLGIGLCIPGLIGRETQTVLRSVSVEFLQGRNVSEDLSEATGIRTVVSPQGQSLAIAERLFGSARWLSDFVMLDAADGPSVGVYSDGELLSGKHGLAGPFELLRITRSSMLALPDYQLLETDRLFAEAVSQSAGERLDLDQIWQLCQSGQLNVEQQLDNVCRTYAANVAAAINLFNPATLYLYSRVLAFDPGMLPRLIRIAGELSLNHSFDGCEIRPASVTPQDAAIAAIIDELTRSLGPRLNQNNPAGNANVPR